MNTDNTTPAINVYGSLFSLAQQRTEILSRLLAAKAKTVAIWGAGINGDFVARALLDSPVKIVSFYDRALAGKRILGIPVLPEPDSVKELDAILICMNGPVEAIKRITGICKTSKTTCIQVINIEHGMATTTWTAAAKHHRLDEYAGTMKGQRCFVVGNGPSLNKIDMSRLAGEIVIGSNRCFIGFEKWGVQFPFWGVEDMEVGGWQSEGWKKMRGTVKFVPADMLKFADPNDTDVCPIQLFRTNFTSTYPLFSIYPDLLFSGRTVTYVLLQLAAIMGCSPIYLIGVDFRFTQSNVAPEPHSEVWWQKGKDQNHFDPSYIPEGRFLHQPHLDLQRLAFMSARQSAKLHGFEIFNATPGSALDVFPHVEYASLFTKK
ncbi:MAG: hypothetical protein A2283_02095 [Lentisphaerae bacterium RIFOXYA12_FULL_48_11]|nr:MAG: hypothetical protein A2283_02095 [Lentisphaerae bacterium RIFOXYA12_FULL_48_11]